MVKMGGEILPSNVARLMNRVRGPILPFVVFRRRWLIENEVDLLKQLINRGWQPARLII